MPIYTYRAKEPDQTTCANCKEVFDVFQKITEEALANCPDCGAPIVRIFHATQNLRDSSTKTILSDDNLKKHGFKKLVNAGGGKFDEVV
jgi:putative FmdB family regulatory protein